MSNQLQLISPAKLNLFLHIINKREDNYHNLQTIFQLINYGDHLTYHNRADHLINISSENCHIPVKQNLIYKAAQLLKNVTSYTGGCEIVIDKRIPVGGGLGGGSSNAATTLLALNTLWGLNLTIADLHPLAKRLGADVPVFLHGHSAWGEGIGEDLTPMILPPRHYLILVPKTTISTTSLFNDSRLKLTPYKVSINHYPDEKYYNAFEELACAGHPEVKCALDWLKEHSGNGQLTGTGACVFTIIDSSERARTIASHAAKYWQIITCQGLNHSPVHAKLLSN
jgi:4-diphosphocytidyl-2-C-methyl-D-erythritol kinase